MITKILNSRDCASGINKIAAMMAPKINRTTTRALLTTLMTCSVLVDLVAMNPYIRLKPRNRPPVRIHL